MDRKLAEKFLDISGVILVALNDHGQITEINKRGCQILGYKESDLLGSNWFDQCVPESHREQTRRVFEKLLKGKVRQGDYHENPVLTKSGKQRIVGWHNSILSDSNGKPAGTISSGMDLTVPKQVEQALRDSEAKLRAILETAVDGIITINADGSIESVNSAIERLFGYEADELIGKNVSILMPPPHRDEHDNYIRKYLKTGEKKIIGIGREVHAMRKDGSLFPLLLSVSEFMIGDRHMFTGILHDITEEKTLQEQILQTERLAIIGKMAAKVAHEIRNPLSSISLNAELLEEEITNEYTNSDAEEARALIRSMIREIDRVTSLTDEYLQFSRLPHSRPTHCRFKDLVDEVMEFLESELKKKRIRFRFEDSTPPFEVMLDRMQFRRVLLNVVRNAIESMPKGGSLKIWTERSDSTGIIHVEDTGVGIPEEHLEQIFEPFFTTKDFGTGLGLALTQQVVHEHGGRIRCNSTPGKGTAFQIEVPLVQQNRGTPHAA